MDTQIKPQEEHSDFCRQICQEDTIRNSIFSACSALYEAYTKAIFENLDDTRIVCLNKAAEKLHLRKNEALCLVQMAFVGRFFLFANDEILFNEMLDRGLRMYID